nr:hypothetical protein [uncultured Thiodictyon sp.]
MHHYRFRGSQLAERPEEILAVGVGEEDRRAVDPARDHVQGVVGYNDSGMSGHGGEVVRMGNVS